MNTFIDIKSGESSKNTKTNVDNSTNKAQQDCNSAYSSESNLNDSLSNSHEDSYLDQEDYSQDYLITEECKIKNIDTNYNDDSMFDPEEFIRDGDLNSTSGQNIICVELMNNNKIYINYDQNWSIKNVR